MANLTLSDTVYNKAKWAVQIVLPAATALYLGLAQIYDWANASQNGAALALVTTFLGVVLGVSNRNYAGDGQVVFSTDPETEREIYKFNLTMDPSDIVDKDKIVFKVSDYR